MAKPRKASKAPFPYGAPGVDKVAYFTIEDNQPVQLTTEEDVIVAIDFGHDIYAAWPGKTRTDIFIIDDVKLLMSSFE